MEIHENRFPVIYEYQKLRKDAGGPGQFRGGRGVEKRVQILAEGIATELNDRHTTSPWGLFGGRPGASNRHLIIRDGQTTTFPKLFGVRSPSKFDNVRLVEGDISIFGTGGGGGYGDPLGRDYERVRADVENGAISVEGAEKDYGTVIGNDGRVDVDASEVIREGTSKGAEMMRRLGIDVGGTFTDVAFYDDESGTLRRAKVSTTPQAPGRGRYRRPECSRGRSVEP